MREPIVGRVVGGHGRTRWQRRDRHRRRVQQHADAVDQVGGDDVGLAVAVEVRDRQTDRPRACGEVGGGAEGAVTVAEPHADVASTLRVADNVQLVVTTSALPSPLMSAIATERTFEPEDAAE